MNDISVLMKETPQSCLSCRGRGKAAMQDQEGSCPEQTCRGLDLGLPREVNFGALLVTPSKLFFYSSPNGLGHFAKHHLFPYSDDRIQMKTT